jgi:phosphatidylinositol glycan class B
MKRPLLVQQPTPTPTPTNEKDDDASDHRTSLLRLYLIVCVYRIANALIVQTQFDADEYWQCLEPAYCLAFSSAADHTTSTSTDSTEYGCAFTWEWTRRFEDPGNEMNQIEHTNILHAWLNRAFHGPVRSFVPVLPTYALYVIARRIGIDTPWVIARGPLVVNAVLVAAPTDIATIYTSRWIGGRTEAINSYCMHIFGRVLLSVKMTEIEWWALITSITSWFNGYALVRTYSNSMEAVLLSVGIALLCPDLFGANSMDHCARDSSLSPTSAVAFILGGLSVCVRFTAIAAWIPIGLIFSVRTKTIRERATLFGLCACFGVLGVLLGTVLDRIIYGFWAVPFLGSIHFNVVEGNGALYGTHHPLWYLFAGLPAMCGALTPLLLIGISMAFAESTISARRVVVTILIFYVALHSFSAHKEFRFLLPMLHLVCILSAYFISDYYVPLVEKCVSGIKCAFRRRFIFCYLPLLLLNYPHLFFLTSTHQAASIGMNRKIVRNIQEMEKNVSRHGQKGTPETQRYNIHYLMGCHSTPLYSHLHIRGTRIRARALDCSPQCRADPDALCEADRFQADPFGFVKMTYTNHRHSLPDFIVIFDESVRDKRVQRALLDMGMSKVAKALHEIDSLRFQNGSFSIAFREMLLYQKIT